MTLTQINKAGLDELALDHVFTIGASGTDHYTFQGEGLNGTVNDPTLYLTRGKTYRFENGTGSHPIRIQSTSGASGTAYNTGVTNNAGSGTVIVEVQHDAPDVLYYQCTSHANMNGVLYITGALADGGVTTAKLAADAVNGTKIADNAVAAEHIAANAVGSSELADNAVDTAAIVNVAVTSGKIADSAITNSKVSSSAAISGTKLADNSIPLAKLPNGDSNNNGKFLRANNGAAPSFETVSIPAGTTINNNADNRVITGSGTANTLNGESNAIIDSSGHMGLGVTPNTNWPSNGDFKALQVGTGACLFGRGSGDEDRGGIAVNYYSTGSGNKYLANGHAARIYMNDGRIDFNNAAENSSGANASLTFSTPMSIAPDGNVGIGLTSPSAKLDIGGLTNTGGQNVDALKITRTDGLQLFGINWNVSANDVSFSGNTKNYVFKNKSGSAESIRFPSTGGITFNGDTAAANALDDYEEGTYTVVVSGTGGWTASSSSESGRYVKIGNMCFVNIYYSSSSMAGISGSSYLRVNLPFTAANVGSTAGTLSCSYWNTGTSDISWLAGKVIANEGYCRFEYHNGNNNNTNTPTKLNFSSQLEFRGTIAYQTA